MLVPVRASRVSFEPQGAAFGPRESFINTYLPKNTFSPRSKDETFLTFILGNCFLILTVMVDFGYWIQCDPNLNIPCADCRL